ncbi:MAG: hypothetical protein U0946_02810, partial [Patescibacteria group bacterium]|nr:hypothetical protein [Patescibacteria group bacterium]
MAYYSKKPIRSFQDLQVYQLSYNLAVKIVKQTVRTEPPDLLCKTALSIPRLLASAHSYRFGNFPLAVETLETAMLNCNLAVHYLSLARDLERSDLIGLDFNSLSKQ